MHKKLIPHVLKTISNFFLKLEKKRRAQSIFLKSLKILQKKVVKNHKFLVKFGIINSAPILKSSLVKSFFKKTSFYVSFVQVNKKIINVAKVLKQSFIVKSLKSLISNIARSFLFSIKAVQITALKAVTKSQMEALTLKKFFRFKWF